MELIPTTPPKALVGSQVNAFLKELIWFLSAETPHGLLCLIIADPIFFLKVFNMDKAE